MILALKGGRKREQAPLISFARPPLLLFFRPPSFVGDGQHCEIITLFPQEMLPPHLTLQLKHVKREGEKIH